MTARWGRTPRYAAEHTAAANVQAAHPGLIVWFGERSGHFYLMDAEGLHERDSIDGLTLLAWWRTHRPRPRGSWSSPAVRT
ncbi:hypothetical protein [Streptomonospora litoralis]|uniref:Uncharacterized protein n=1 Tax=Streptomonospora litoralis TaxID=2498135 RepID=A0A4V0ZK86_9ACTN|nr:hypothetical protein [Streptomonospora litoralis]QBI56112.1 hypothetical protein EKD16_21795 [Streptomonospora litoralis]